MEFLNPSCKKYFLTSFKKFFVRSEAVLRDLDPRSDLSDENGCAEPNDDGESAGQAGNQLSSGAYR